MSTSFAVLFDMDGVIVDTNPFHKITIKQFCDKYGFHLSEEELVQKVYGRTNKDWLTNLFGELSPTQLEAYANEKESLFREAFKDHMSPVKGLIEFLEALKKNSIPAAIATSAPPANLEFIVKGLNLTPYFKVMLDETYVTNGKPNPEIYLKTAKALGLTNHRCIVIEDSISGIKSGKAAGSKVIGITTTHSKEEMHETDLVINDFTELTIEKLQSLLN